MDDPSEEHHPNLVRSVFSYLFERVGIAVSFVFGLLVFGILIYPIILVIDLKERCRRRCPVHKEWFHREKVTICPEEAEINRRLAEKGRRMYERGYFPRVAPINFPYANDDRGEFTKAGTYRRRYCPGCREAIAYYREVHRLPDLSPEERAAADAEALRELEALEKQLHRPPQRGMQVLDETMGNEKADTGEL